MGTVGRLATSAHAGVATGDLHRAQKAPVLAYPSMPQSAWLLTTVLLARFALTAEK